MRKKIYYKNKIIGELTYRKDDTKSDRMIKIIQKNYPSLKAFFGFEIAPIKIHLLYSRAEIDKYWGSKTPIWMSGFIKGKNKIYVLSLLVCRKVSCHLEGTINKIVVHELVHLFIKKINKSPFGWLSEGLALFLAKQIKGKSIKREDWKFLAKAGFITNSKLAWTKVASRSGYQASYLLVSFLLKQYGKNKLMKLLKINANEKNVHKRLEQVLGINLNGFVKNFQKKLKLL